MKMFEVVLDGREDLFHGVISLQKNAYGIMPMRFTDSLYEMYRTEKYARFSRARGSAGMRIQFRTTARKMAMNFRFDSFIREYFGFDVSCDGILVKRITQNTAMESFAFEVELPGEGPKEVKIAFPWQVECTVTSLQLDDISMVEPIAIPGKPIAMIGDSITQGFEVASPGESYAARLADGLGKEWYNLSVGGMIMRGEANEGALDYPWDAAVLAYGVNDCSKKVPIKEFKQETMRSLKALTSRAGARIFVITPLPWPGSPAELSLQDYRDVIIESSGQFKQLTLINGPDLLENDSRYFADAVHPNSLGMEIMAGKLLPLLREAGVK